MQALSIRQPWAWLIVNAGKRVENRTWSTRHRGPILIHAAKGMTKAEYQEVAFFVEYHYPELAPPNAPEIKLPAFDALERGGIIGRAKVIDCIRSKGALPPGITRSQADRFIVPWFFGPVGIVLGEVEPMPFVPMKGALGLFEVDEAVLQAAA